jgi:hypothetical protein
MRASIAIGEVVGAGQSVGDRRRVYFGHRILPDHAPHDRSLLDEPWNVVRDKEHRYTSDRHLVTVGPNGSGKTRRLLIPNLVFLENWSVLVVDPKGTLAALTGPFRESQHPNSVMVIDPFGVLEREYPALVKRYPFLKSAGFNPVAALDPESDDFPDDARGLAEKRSSASRTRTSRIGSARPRI